MTEAYDVKRISFRNFQTKESIHYIALVREQVQSPLERVLNIRHTSLEILQRDVHHKYWWSSTSEFLVLPNEEAQAGTQGYFAAQDSYIKDLGYQRVGNFFEDDEYSEEYFCEVAPIESPFRV